MSRLISFGDSFTWGTDLSDSTPGMPRPSQLTWSALFARHRGLKYTCLARPGASNHEIARIFFNYSNDITDQDLVVINWSWIDRWEYFNSNLPKHLYGPTHNEFFWLEDQHQWVQVRPDDNKEKHYWANYHSELNDKWKSLQLIYSAKSWLDKRKIPYLMTCVDSLIIDQEFHTPNYILTLQNEVLDSLFWFDNQGFVDWSRTKGYPVSAGWHPLELAHSQAAELIFTSFDTQNTNGR